MKDFFKALWHKISAGITKLNTALGKLLRRPLLFCFSWSILLSFILEVLGRRSLFDAVTYFVGSPLMFFYNALIIMLTLSIALLFKRRYFVLFIVTLFWLGSGVANCVLLGFRTTPFSAIDLTLIPYALSIIDIYLSKFQIILVTSLLVLTVIAILFIAFKAPKYKGKIPYLRFGCVIVVIATLVFTISYVGTKTQVMGTRFGNIADAYENYGFAYCLSNSFVDTGIKKPANYTKETIDEIVTPLKENALDPEEAKTPNIIFLQLESFFDANTLKNIDFSADPNPVFSHLMEEYPSGYLNVPTVGAGTANTEFEILTGMSLDYFGAGEYPYKTVLLDQTCESLANNLKELGYYTYAMHDNRASFYGRNTVFSQLGFDCFDSKEYMQNIEYTQAGWAKDKVLIDEILKCLNNTEGQDFIYSITVQGHGKYTEAGLDHTEPITLSSADENIDLDAYACFIKNQHEVDTVIGELLNALNNLDEDTVVVMYGDHLPSLDMKASDLTNGNLYQTEYVIWNNMGLKAEDTDVYSYQLSSYVLGLLGIDNGIINKYHQQNKDKFSYLQNLDDLEYDMLYGKKYSLNETPYTASEMRFGVSDIYITGIQYFPGTSSVYVFGEGFTDASKIYVNYEQVGTRFLNNNTLVISGGYDLDNGDVLVVKQTGKNRIPLSSSVAFTYDAATERVGGYTPGEDDINYGYIDENTLQNIQKNKSIN